MIEIENIWQELEHEARVTTREGIIRRRIMHECPHDLFIAFQKVKNRRLFLMKVSSEAVLKNHTVPAVRGFILDIQRFLDAGSDETLLALSLTDARYRDMFSLIVSDIIDHVTYIENETDCIQAFLERIFRWQHFLEKHKPDALGPEAQRGLYGELWFLREVVLKNLTHEEAIRCWTGPEYDRHDFQFNTCCVEIKTTASKQHQKLWIANERQLDDSNIQALYIVHLSLDTLQHLGETLPAIVNSIRESIRPSESANSLFEDKLFEAGYLIGHESAYSGVGYAKRDVNAFRVAAGFPRITEGDVPNGVGDISYSILVAECKHFEIKMSDLQKEVGGHEAE
jgi:hypothetical protein